jgi:glycosyltransferase
VDFQRRKGSAGRDADRGAGVTSTTWLIGFAAPYRDWRIRFLTGSFGLGKGQRRRRETSMKISVVTASYNSEATIGFTVESFLGQKHPEKEMLVIDGASSDATLRIVESFGSEAIRVFSEKDKGVYDAMNKGFRLFQGDAVGFLNSDDTFHDSNVLSDIAGAMQGVDIVYGDLDMVADHRTKSLIRSWKGGAFKRNAFHLGWVPPHPTFYMRREVAEKVGDYDLSYITTADYDYMLRALALNDFRVRYLPRVVADFQMGGISTRGFGVTIRGNLECLRSRQVHLHAPIIDAAFFLRFARRIFQIR